MTEGVERTKRPRVTSLYLGLILSIIFGILVATALYLSLRVGTNFLIERYYVTDEKKSERRESYLENFQKWADEHEMSSEDTALLAKWASEHPYVYLLIYKQDQLFFTSDMKDESTESGSQIPEGGEEGGQVQEKPGIQAWLEYLGFSSMDEFRNNREELIAEAEANGQKVIQLSDGAVRAAVTEFTEELYYDVTNVASFIMAALALMAVLIAYMRRVILKIKRLENDVTIVAHHDMNHKIVCDGEDELARLSHNVETMRNSLIENIKREREAVSANTELVTSVSHDLRTPLTVLLGYIDMMKSRVGDDEVMKNYIAASENTAMRLKNLSDGMFRYALAFGNNEEKVEREEYDARMLLEQLFSEHVLLLREEGFSLDIDAPDTIIADGEILYTDAQCLMRIVDNVFSNVRKYADPSRPVKLEARRDGSGVCISVKNTIAKVPNVAESNGIGLKTCTRLAELVSAEFVVQKRQASFEVLVKLKLFESKK